MKKNILLLLAAFMAIFATGANDQWPVTLTTADGLPGAKPIFDNTIAKNIYHYRSPLLTFDEAQRAAAPGQSAVFYDGDVVVGGGIIQA